MPLADVRPARHAPPFMKILSSGLAFCESGRLSTFVDRMRRNPWSALCAVALAAMLAYGYAGPIVCASAHGHDASAPHHAHHEAPVPAGQHGLAPVGGHAGVCGDMAHCGLHLMGPAGAGTPRLTAAPEDVSRAPLVAMHRRGTLTPPATPPPRA